MAVVEQRKFQRVPFTGDVLINDAILAKGIDISEGGLYVHTGRSFPLDSFLRVKVTLLTRELNLVARVRSCQESVGMGLNFMELSYEARNLIRQYVAAGREAAAPQKKKVLLVDDSEPNRRINKSKLVLEGYAVIEATDGIDAIAKLSQGAPPDLVVLDLYMEKMDGHKVLSYIKGNDAFKAVPVVVLSARGNQAEIDKAMSAGADGFLVKMMTSPAKLAECVGKFFPDKKD
ncbi:MAG TPA: response regulator [Nitrospirota bacterium]|nr:response regulator [Nitrospirota bacterium]